MTIRTRPGAVLLALSLAACDGLFEPGERAQEQILFKRYAQPNRITDLDSADLYRVNADGTGLQNLTSHVARYGAPSVSPDGRRVLFHSNRGDDIFNHVWVMNTDGTGLTKLVDEPSSSPQWSPDGTRIAFHMAHQDDGLHVWVMNADGSDPVKVSGFAMQVGNTCGSGSTTTNTRISLIGWLPDGRIAFTRYYCGFGPRFFTVNADGSGFAQTQTDLNQTAWSPEGSRLVFPRLEGGYWRVILMDADGTGARMLTTQGTSQRLPGKDRVWSRDGNWIMFFADSAGMSLSGGDPCGWTSLPYVINVSGSGLQRLTDFCGADFHGWSRSGDQLAFTSAHDSGVYDLYVVNRDGSGLKKLTSSPQLERDAQWLPRP